MPDKAIEMRLQGEFLNSKRCVVLWSDSPKEYFCVEPIFEAENLFDTKEGFHLEAGQSIVLGVSFKLL